MIRLKSLKAYEYRGKFYYHITHNTSAGRKNVYNVTIPTSDDPVVIGRELTMKDVRRLIEEYEVIGDALEWWVGDRNTALAALFKHQEKP